MLNIPIAVQDALREGTMRKNYKMKVNDVDPDTGERTYLYTIDNDTLVSESVKIDERMVTGKVLKFGLCEGSSLEFQYFDHPNINGKDVQVYCSVEYVDGNGDVAWYDIPMGWYTVDQCPMQWDTGIYKVTAYNKLKSDYLDAKANSEIEDIITQGECGSAEVSLFRILEKLLNGYSIEQYAQTKVDIQPTMTDFFHDTYAKTLNLAEDSEGTNVRNLNIYILGIVFINSSSITWDIHGFYKLKYYLEELKEKIMELYEPYLDQYVPSDSGTPVWITLREYLQGEGTAIQFTGDADISFENSGSSTYLFQNLLIQDDIVETESLTNMVYMGMNIPVIVEIGQTGTPVITSNDFLRMKTVIEQWAQEIGTMVELYIEDVPDIDKMRFDSFDFADVTLRELQSAVYETACQYGKLDRETDLFTGVELNQGGLYPADTLYPDNALYPSGNMEHPFPSTYSKLWTDTVGEQSFRYLIITYKAMENGQEVEKKLQRTVNEHGTTNYNMSDNWLFRNLVWTSEDVGVYADAMVLKMQDIRWFPFEMWCAGLPYVETGDAIEITDRQGNTHTSYVLTRTLDGIHNLQDTFINGELDIF